MGVGTGGGKGDVGSPGARGYYKEAPLRKRLRAGKLHVMSELLTTSGNQLYDWSSN